MKNKKKLIALTSLSADLHEIRLSLEDCLPIFTRHSRTNSQNLFQLSVYCGQIHTEIIRMSKVQTRIAQALEQIAESLNSNAVNYDHQTKPYPAEDE